MNLLDPGDAVPSQWCFPFVYMSGKLRTNLLVKPLTELQSQKDIKSLFQFDDSELKDLLKGDV